jgi:hypothetical protein
MITRHSTSEVQQPSLFMPHPNLSDEINRNICQSEIEGGVSLDRLPVGCVLEMETRNHFYELENRGNGKVLIMGHPKFCPEPVLVHVNGSTWGRAMLKLRFIGRGMFLEFDHPEFGVVRTSRIQEIRELPRVRADSEAVYGHTG